MRLTRKNNGWGDLARAAAACLAVALAMGAAGPRAAESAATNLDLLDELTAGVVGELRGKFQEGLAGRAVRLKPFGPGEEYQFVTNVFMEELTSAGITTLAPLPPAPANAAPGTAPADTLDGDALTLQYQAISFGLRYVDVHRSYVVGGKRVERQAQVRILATLADASGKVLWVGEAQREASDEIDYGDAARIEAGSYQFARPVMPSGGWGKYAEPVFVTGIIVGLIYLFFSNQSDN